MNTPAEAIQHNEVLERLLLDRNTTEKIGVVEQLWIDPQSHQVKGIVGKSNLLGLGKQFFPWEQISSIGNDSILINPSSSEEKIKRPDKTAFLIGHEIWTDRGNQVGKLVDFLFNPNTGAIASYLFTSKGWKAALDGVYVLPLSAISSIGEKRLIVLESVAEEPQIYTQGITQKIGQVKDFIQKDYSETKKDLETVVNKAQNVADKLRDD